MGKKISIVVNMTAKEVREIIGILPKHVFQTLTQHDMIFLDGKDIKTYLSDCPDLNLILGALTIGAYRKEEDILPDEEQDEDEDLHDEVIEKHTFKLNKLQAEIIKNLAIVFSQQNN